MSAFVTDMDTERRIERARARAAGKRARCHPTINFCDIYCQKECQDAKRERNRLTGEGKPHARTNKE